MRKNKGVWVSVRPLGKHTRTSEEGSKKKTCEADGIGGGQKMKERGISQPMHASSVSCRRKARHSVCHTQAALPGTEENSAYCH